MITNDLTTDRAPRPLHQGPRPIIRLILVATAVACIFAAMAIGIPWLIVLTPRWLIRRAAIAFLWGLLAAFVAAVPATLVLGPWSAVSAARARRRHDRVALARALRRVLLACGCAAGLIAMEAGSGIVHRRSYHIPELPTRFAAGSGERRAPD